jgi:hypothetical protein
MATTKVTLAVIENAAVTTAKLASAAVTTAKLAGGTLGAIGFAATPLNAGTKSSGTYTPAESSGNFQYAVNGGAHTLAPPTNNCTIVVQYTNNGSAGTITVSGFTLVDGDDATTTDGDDFFYYITKLNGFSLLTVKALQ